VTLLPAVISFLVSLIVSAIVIYVVTKMFGGKGGIGTAFLAALVGAVIYSVAFYFLGGGTLASVLGGVAWLIALGSLYKIGWLKALVIAIVIWVAALLVGIVLPTVAGPL